MLIKDKELGNRLYLKNQSETFLLLHIFNHLMIAFDKLGFYKDRIIQQL